jgi:hypothetical protein
MVALFLIFVCLAVFFLMVTAVVKFVFVPINNVREKRRVNQDRNAFFQNGISPFVQIDIQRIQEHQETETVVEMGDHEETEEEVEISNNPALNSPRPTYFHELKPTMDITSLNTKPVAPIISNSNSIFKQTNVIIN